MPASGGCFLIIIDRETKPVCSGGRLEPSRSLAPIGSRAPKGAAGPRPTGTATKIGATIPGGTLQGTTSCGVESVLRVILGQDPSCNHRGPRKRTWTLEVSGFAAPDKHQIGMLKKNTTVVRLLHEKRQKHIPYMWSSLSRHLHGAWTKVTLEKSCIYRLRSITKSKINYQRSTDVLLSIAYVHQKSDHTR